MLHNVTWGMAANIAPTIQNSVNESFTASFSPFYTHMMPKYFLAMIILFSAVFLTNDVTAQVESPCDCPSITFIGYNEGVTKYSELTSTFQSGYCYYISGTLVIDVDATFSGVKIIMAENAAIHIETGLQCFESYISGCGNMWQGILLIESASLGMFNSVIEDANVGIEMEHNTAIACQFTDFINNYIGISTGSPLNGDVFKMNIDQRDPILGCRFFTSGTLPDPYPGHHYDPAWPTHPTTPYNKGYAAIYISGVSMFRVGKENADETERNEIFNMRNGIIVRHSVADIYGTDIHDLEGEIPRSLPDPLLDLNQNGLHSTVGFIRVSENSMEDLHFGIQAINSLGYITENTIDIVPNIRFSKGIYFDRPQRVDITDNLIYDGRRNIHIIQANNRFDISDNLLIRDGSFAGNTGISIESQFFNGSQTGFVRNNDIEITDGNGAFGIHLVNTRQLSVTDNEINYLIDQGQNNQCAGLALPGSINSVYGRNLILAHSDYNDLSNFGTASDVGSGFNVFGCNTINNFRSNMRFSGPNFMTRLDRNEIQDGGIGLNLVGFVSLGSQIHQGNEWTGDYSEFGAFIESTNPQTTALESQFIVDQSDNTNYFPSSIGPIEVEEVWFRDEPGEELTACLSIPDNPILDQDTLESLVQSSFEFEEYNDEVNWTIKSDLFELVHLFPDVQTNPVLDSFYTEESSTTLGKLIMLQNALSVTYGIEEAVKLAKEDSILTLVTDIGYIDSLLYLKPSDSLSLRALRVLKIDTLNGVFSRWQDLLGDEEEASLAAYEDILDTLEALPTGNKIEESLQFTLIMKARNLLSMSLTGTDSTDIQTMKDEVCPWEIGRASSVVGELQSMFFDTIISPMTEFCENSPFRVSPTNAEISFSDDSLIVSNPFNNQLELTSDLEWNSIRIYNILGQVMYKSDIRLLNESIHTSSWPSGIYHLTVHTPSGYISKQLLCVK